MTGGMTGATDAMTEATGGRARSAEGTTGEATDAITGATGAMTGKTAGVAGLDCSGDRELDEQRPAAGDAGGRPGGRAPPGSRRSRRGGRARV